MSDPFGFATNLLGVTTRPSPSTDPRAFTPDDTWGVDCTSAVAEDGTQITAEQMNEVVGNLRALVRGNGAKIDGITKIVGEDHTDAMLLKAVQHMIQRGRFNFAVDTGAADAIVATPALVPAELIDGMEFVVRIAADNATTTPTANIGGLGAKAIKKADGSALVVGALKGGTEARLRYHAASDAWRHGNPQAAGASGGAAGLTTGLAIDVTSTTAIAVAARAVQMSSAAGLAICLPLTDTLNTATSGLGGMDTGSIAVGHNYMFAVSNGTTTRAVLSASSTSPAAGILTTYPYFALLGSVYYGSGGLRAIRKRGTRVQIICGGPNVSALPMLASGVASQWTSISIASLLPPTATEIDCLFASGALTTSVETTAGVAPNNTYSAGNVTNPAPFVMRPGYNTAGSNFQGFTTYPIRMLLESLYIYWFNVLSTGSLNLLGYGEPA